MKYLILVLVLSGALMASAAEKESASLEDLKMFDCICKILEDDGTIDSNVRKQAATSAKEAVSGVHSALVLYHGQKRVAGITCVESN